jgi:HlyD family secretion protein
VEQAALAKEQFLLKSNVQLRAAEAQRELAAVKLQRAEKLFKEGAGSTLELEEAKLELKVSELKTELAKEETQAKKLEIVKLTKQIEKMRIVSEFDGEMRKVDAALGEVADPQKASMTLVVNNPLKVAVKLPTVQTNAMKLGQELNVRYADSKDWHSAKIVYFDPVADARVGKQLVHLELANPDGRRAGQEVIVKLPDNLAAAKE